jgi:putative SOS response-associated peptidase YedK
VALYEEPSRLARILDARTELLDDDLPPSWNVAPTDSLLGVRQTSKGDRELGAYRWGLVPSWSKTPDVKGTFNARAESLVDKPMFRTAFARWRVLVPVDAFYEWERTGRRSQPYAFTRTDGQPLVFAGLREWWRGKDGVELRTATIVTTEAGPDMPIHDRQPVVLEPEDWELWLDTQVSDPEVLLPLLGRPTVEGRLTHYPVDRAVGNVKNNGPQLLEHATVDESTGELF